MKMIKSCKTVQISENRAKIIAVIALLVCFAIPISADTTYIATDGSGDYNCDGVDDQIEINLALSNAVSGDIVHINAGTYSIENSILINNSNIILVGDVNDTTNLEIPPDQTIIQWPYEKRMIYVNTDDITIQNILFDGNSEEQTYFIENNLLGNKYMEILEITNTHSNILIKDCIFRNTIADAVIPSCTYNLTVDNCSFFDVNHGGVEGEYYNSIIKNCHFECGNSGIRLYYGSGNLFENNTIIGGAYGFEIHAYNNNDLSNNIIRNNSIMNVFTQAIHFDASSTDSTTIENIVIKNNIINRVEWDNPSYGQGIYMEGLWNNMTIENNVITDARVGIEENSTTPTGGNIVIKNNIIVKNREYGIVSCSSNFVLKNNNIWNNSNNYQGISPDTSDISADPMFADSANHDFHLKSEHGRWNGSSWIIDAVTSSCIDSGNPADDYSDEPEPNGGRINIGAYGNTIEASKSSFFGIKDNIINLPKIYALYQNFPNPFIKQTAIGYQLPNVGTRHDVSLQIYDLSGRLVKTLVNKEQISGYYKIKWDGKDTVGKKVATGIYFYRMKTDDFKTTRKLTIIR